MRKLVSVLLTLALAVSLMVVPAVVSAGGGTSETFNVTANRSDTNNYNDVNAKITKTDDLEAGVVEFKVEILDEPPYGGHFHTAATVYISTDINTVDFQVMYFNFLNTGIPSVTEFGWYYRSFPWTGIFDGVPFVKLGDSGTGITATGIGDNAGDPNGDGTQTGDKVFTVSIPIGLLGGPGATYYYALSFSTNVQGAYPEGIRFCVETDASNFATASIPANTIVGLTAETSNITAINVDPTSIDFGTITPGTPNDGDNITVENIGGVTVNVDAYLAPMTNTVFNYLKLGGVPSPGYCGDWADYIISGLKPSLNQTLTTQLVVPETYSGKGIETATLIFEASPA